MDVILLASYVLAIEILCFVCKRVYLKGELDRMIVIVRRVTPPPPDKKWVAGQKAQGGATAYRW